MAKTKRHTQEKETAQEKRLPIEVFRIPADGSPPQLIKVYNCRYNVPAIDTESQFLEERVLGHVPDLGAYSNSFDLKNRMLFNETRNDSAPPSDQSALGHWIYKRIEGEEWEWNKNFCKKCKHTRVYGDAFIFSPCSTIEIKGEKVSDFDDMRTFKKSYNRYESSWARTIVDELGTW